MQVYDLLPPKRVPSLTHGGPLNAYGEKCINAEDIVHNGIVYTPKWAIKEDDVYSVFEVIHLPKSINNIEF